MGALELGIPYKILINLKNAFQGYMNTTNGVRWVQGYLNPISVYEAGTGRRIMSGAMDFPVERMVHQNDPYSFGLRFTVNIAPVIKGVDTALASVVIENCQSFAAVRHFNRDSVMVFSFKDGLVYHFREDVYKHLYTANPVYWDTRSKSWKSVSESTVAWIRRLVWSG